MKFRHKKKKTDIITPVLIFGFAICLILFGLFSVLMVASFKWSAESTVLQMTFQLPAWELTAMAAFIGLIISFAFIMIFEHRILYKNQEKQIKTIEKKIDRLIYEQRKRSIILKDVEDTATKPPSDLVKEKLPYESIDDFIDTFIGMTDAEIEDVAIQLLDDNELIITEADDAPEPDEEKTELLKVIPFKKKNKNS